MRVFVTGGTGFVGKAVIQELIAKKHTVLGLARSEKGAKQLTNLGADVHQGGLGDLDSLRKGAAASEGVIHCAFRNTTKDFTVSNFEAACHEERHAIEVIGNALVGSNKPLVITSGKMLLPPGRLGTEDDREPNTLSPIAMAREKSEVIAMSFASKGVRVSVLRIPPVNYGEGDEGLVPMVIDSARKNMKSIYSTTHVRDTAKAYCLALERAPAGSTLHGVAEQGTQLKHIAEVIGKRLNLPVESRGWDGISKHYGWLANIVALDNYISSEKTQALLNWKPEQSPLLNYIGSDTLT
ncbi:hypothetical protein PENSTE_c018G03846 [Penicillium steckii]|uniref:NAD-dependent epimerase/dehydratase domain-containing protein n=1 Tax=Penicillium steckii TaxID=303698 RepID=A0A1V6SWE7_9EURO|nr:hypothetical protein PENSTE_c018G03846 [Penicillium steckii]